MSGAISNSIVVPGYSSTNRVPGVFSVVDASQANTGTLNQRTLIMGQMTASGTAVSGTAVISAGVGDAITSYGAGSLLALMTERYRALDLTGEIWCLPLGDTAGAAAASGSVTVS